VIEFEKQVHNRGQSVAIINEGRTKTYNELNRDANAFGNWVNDHGYEKVAMFMPNLYEFFVAQIGALKAGAAGVPVNYMFGGSTISYVLGDSQAEVLVTPADDVDRVADAVADAGVEQLVSVGDAEGADCTLAEVLDGREETLAAAPKRDSDLFNLNYTSGTTGDPKGVFKTHRNMGAHIDNMEYVWKLGPDQTWINAGPIYHTAGLESMSLPLLQAGGTLVLLKWDVDEFHRQVERHRPSNAYVVGSMLVDLRNYDAADEWDTASLQNVFCGGAPVDQAVYDAVAEKYDVVASEFLGFTEAGISFTYPIGTLGTYEPPGQDSYKVPDSCGKPLYNQIEARIVNPSTGDVVSVLSPDGETTPGTGELQYRGESVFEKYYELPEKNAEAFTEDGWYRTGDIVSVDEEGYVYYEDRDDNMIITGGENVYPGSVEPELNAIPGVSESAVFPVPDERWGEMVVAAVVPLPDSDVDEASIIAAAKDSDELADYEVPKAVYIRDSLPKTPTNSIRRPDLTAEYADE
jgi:long-chain acyl-CoA synthetase